MLTRRYAPSHERVLEVVRKLLEERLSIALTPEFYNSFVTACSDTDASLDTPGCDVVQTILTRQEFEKNIESISESWLGKEVKKHIKEALSKALKAALNEKD